VNFEGEKEGVWK